MKMIKKIIYLSFIIFVLFSCSTPQIYVFLATLNIKNDTGKTLFATPLGIDAQHNYFLLPIVEKKKDNYFYSKKEKDFKITPDSVLSIQFDYDDIQFSGIILISDHQNFKAVLITEDSKRTEFYYPPLKELYIINEDILTEKKDTFSKYDTLFKKLVHLPFWCFKSGSNA